MPFAIEILAKHAHISPQDFEFISRSREVHNQFGLAYQLAFVRLCNFFPDQGSLKIDSDLVNYLAYQLNFPANYLDLYVNKGRTQIQRHQAMIMEYCAYTKFQSNKDRVADYVIDLSHRIYCGSNLMGKVRVYLRQNSILEPSDNVLSDFVNTHRASVHRRMQERLDAHLSSRNRQAIDELVYQKEGHKSLLQTIKQSPSSSSVKTINRLCKKLNLIHQTGVLEIDLEFIGEAVKKQFSNLAKKSDVSRLKSLPSSRRYLLITCYLQEAVQDIVDHLVESFDKLITKAQNSSKREVEQFNKSKERQIKKSLATFKELSSIILDSKIPDAQLRTALFEVCSQFELLDQLQSVENVLDPKNSETFMQFKKRHSYFRQFTPELLKVLDLVYEGQDSKGLLESLEILKRLNQDKDSNLHDFNRVELGFLKTNVRRILGDQDRLDRASWECAVVSSLRDEIKSGNFAIRRSKKFREFKDFFDSESKWESNRAAFFKRAGLPKDPHDGVSFLRKKLRSSYDKFLVSYRDNKFTSINTETKSWSLSKDPALSLTVDQKVSLIKHKALFSQKLREIHLPDLLIEVDNQIGFSRSFMDVKSRMRPECSKVRDVLAAVLCHACNVGPYTMAKMVDGINYSRLKTISDWHMDEDRQREALAKVVNSISSLKLSKFWGEGQTSSSDGQRFLTRRRVLEQSYSKQCRDYALEFYTFIADNYAPFFSLPIECKNRDAPYVLDGILYNESDLDIEEHYTDTHGYTENNFAAFAMFGKQFSPRIKGIESQRIYMTDPDYDYGELAPLLKHQEAKLNLNLIHKYWDKIAHFYYSLEQGHTTASNALRRLNGFSKTNHFYKAHRDFGRLFKTEFILKYLSVQDVRLRTRRGTLKSEELHSLARDLHYAKLGKMDKISIDAQRYSASCLTLVLAAIIYWQIQEMSRVISEYEDTFEFDPEIISHLSPIRWENVLLYGRYNLDESLIST